MSSLLLVLLLEPRINGHYTLHAKVSYCMYHAPLLVRQLKPVDCQYVAQLELYAFVNSFWEEHSVVIVNLRNNLALEHIATTPDQPQGASGC